MLLPLFYGFAFYLVSHGQDVEGKNACWGTNGDDSSLTTGWGPGFQNSCVHSGSNEGSGGDTVWYNYVLATAGTIIDENTSEQNPATNITRATESVCPKGWTLPTETQTRTIGPNGRSSASATYVSSFSPVSGGAYFNGHLQSGDLYGFWWASGVQNSLRRYRLVYVHNDGVLYTSNDARRFQGYYIRCVPKS